MFLHDSWTVDAIFLNDSDITDNFSDTKFLFIEGGFYASPRKLGSKPASRSKDLWSLERTSFNSSTIDLVNNSGWSIEGSFQVEILSRTPKAMVLHGDSLRIVLREGPKFSLRNTSIPAPHLARPRDSLLE